MLRRFKEWLKIQKSNMSMIDGGLDASLAETVQLSKPTILLNNKQLIELSIAIEADIPDIVQIQKLSYNGTTPWGEGALTREITHNKRALYLMAKDQKQAVAFIGMWFIDGEAHITNIAVVPEKRRNGLAYSLMEEVIRLAKQQNMEKVSLEVRVSNKQAQNLYKKLEFKERGIKKEYYVGDHEDALEMSLQLLRE